MGPQSSTLSITSDSTAGTGPGFEYGSFFDLTFLTPDSGLATVLQNGLPNVDQLIALAAPANLYEGNSRDSIFHSRLFDRGRKHAHFDFELDSVTVTPVPLPASGLFLLTGLGGLLVTGRRRLGR